MRAETDATITTALAHLGRFAFFTRDNPYASMWAGEPLPESERSALGRLLDGELDADDWLRGDDGSALLNGIDIACLPRDLQLTGDRSVTVTSVHAFLRAPLFWWLVSVLWCMTAGRRLDAFLEEGVKGYRLHQRFVADPPASGFMFKNPTSSYNAWKRHVVRASLALPGRVLAANTVDIADFYYSIRSGPKEILASFDDPDRTGADPADAAERQLTTLLQRAHTVYAIRSAEVRPRTLPEEQGRLTPLPVGLPSSRVLANMVISLVLRDLEAKEAVTAVAAFADDLVVLTPTLPEPLEAIRDYFNRLGILDADDDRLDCPSAQHHAILQVNIEKSGTSYSRSVGNPDEVDADEEPSDDAHEVGVIDPYLGSDPGPEWGGLLRTVLRAPQRRERAPRRLERQLEVLVGDITVGLDAERTALRLRNIVEGFDASVFLALLLLSWAEMSA